MFETCFACFFLFSQKQARVDGVEISTFFCWLFFLPGTRTYWWCCHVCPPQARTRWPCGCRARPRCARTDGCDRTRPTWPANNNKFKFPKNEKTYPPQKIKRVCVFVCVCVCVCVCVHVRVRVSIVNQHILQSSRWWGLFYRTFKTGPGICVWVAPRVAATGSSPPRSRWAWIFTKFIIFIF